MHPTIRYSLIEARGRLFLLSQTSLYMLQRLTKFPKGAGYSDLKIKECLANGTKKEVPINSLYVFAERLEKAGLLKRVKVFKGTPRRLGTVLKPTCNFLVLKMHVIK